MSVYSPLFLSTMEPMYSSTLSPALGGCLGLSVILGLTSEHLILVWVSMELNMLMFLGLIILAGATVGEGIKYFLVQSVASSVFLGTAIAAQGGIGGLMGTVVLGCLLVKLGAAPFHQWFVGFMSRMAWGAFMVAATVQKLIPLFIMIVSTAELWVIVTLACGVSVLGSVSQTFIKKLLAYSSIFGVGWMVGMCPSFSPILVFLGVYSLGLGCVMIATEGVQSFSVASRQAVKASKGEKAIIVMGFFSMGGIPPFMGFYAKLMVLLILMSWASAGVATLLAVSSIFILLMYVRVMQGALMESEGAPLLEMEGLTFSFGAVSVMLLFGAPLMLFILSTGVWHKSFWFSST